MAPNWATLDARFDNAESRPAKSHYEAVAPYLMKSMHKIHDGLRFQMYDFMSYHSDPYSAVDGIGKRFKLNDYEGRCLSLLRECLATMKKKFGNAPEMSTRVDFLEHNFYCLLRSMKSRELAAAGGCRAEEISTHETKPDINAKSQVRKGQDQETIVSSPPRFATAEPKFSQSIEKTVELTSTNEDIQGVTTSTSTGKDVGNTVQSTNPSEDVNEIVEHTCIDEDAEIITKPASNDEDLEEGYVMVEDLAASIIEL